MSDDVTEMDAGTPSATESTGAAARSSWDFGLMVATVAILGALGVQSLVGTLYSWWATRTIADWQQVGYPGFVTTMNAIAGPLLVALVVVMGLCVPKRLFSRGALIAVSAGLIAIGLAAWALTGSPSTGLAAYLLGSCTIQIAVVVLTLAGARSLKFVSESRLAKVGSGLLHLGFILVALDIAALQGTQWFMPGFWASFVLAMGGSALAFHAKR